ncbi:PucR family transcriptional regulator [Actinoplanes subtropicus]|uniref:PucR family transcriptional regulator n=1 Tax=Actinoplanes subtropicus TaxID=543632 RepID=UPI00146FF844|nr:PucR family transcriptional regulator [Actinoplanes subtropicus]
MRQAVGRSPQVGRQSSATLPEEVREAISVLAGRLVPLGTVLRSVWLAHTHVMGEVLTGREELVDADRQIRRNRELADLAAASAESNSKAIADVYRLEEGRHVRGVLSDAARQLVHDILAGACVLPHQAERVLGIDPADRHLAVLLSSDPASPLSSNDLARFAVALSNVLRGGPPMLLSERAGRLWMWTRWDCPIGPSFPDTARALLSPPPGLRACAGRVVVGLDGIRRSHEAALVSEQFFGEHGDSWLCTYTDVAMLALVMRDPGAARAFVEHTLGGLGEPGRRSAELRETLRVYLTCRRSRAQAAQALHIARGTVAYRVKQAVELLGRAAEMDSLTVRLALDVAHHLFRDEHDPATGQAPARIELTGNT